MSMVKSMQSLGVSFHPSPSRPPVLSQRSVERFLRRTEPPTFLGKPFHLSPLLSLSLTLNFSRVDHFLITAGTARTACQIYNDAALVAHFPFDSIGTWNDYTVNLFNGLSGSLTQLSVGRVGQAIYFGTSTSYFQSECFTSTQTGQSTLQCRSLDQCCLAHNWWLHRPPVHSPPVDSVDIATIFLRWHQRETWLCNSYKHRPWSMQPKVLCSRLTHGHTWLFCMAWATVFESSSTVS